MAEIIPDTSKYTELADRLIAFALILAEDSKGSQIQALIDDCWEGCGERRNLPGMAENCILGRDYRTKPKPRELWVMFDEGGKWISTFSEKVIPYPCHTIVRFVEQP